MGLSELTGFQDCEYQQLRARNSELKSKVRGTFGVFQLSERKENRIVLSPVGKSTPKFTSV